MNHLRILKLANVSMFISALAFFFATLLAYGFESSLPLMTVTLLHVAQLILAGLFKVAYVIRIVEQKQLGMVVS